MFTVFRRCYIRFFPYTIGFPILLQQKTSKFPIVRPFEAAMFQDVHWLLIEYRTFFRSISVALRKPYKRQLLYFRGCYRSRFVQLNVSIFSGSSGKTSIQIKRRMLILTLPDLANYDSLPTHFRSNVNPQP